MAQDTEVQQLIINKLTEAQYKAIEIPNANELYLTTDGSISYNELTDKPTVDQTYDETSTNAVSGVAVADAISGKADIAPEITSLETSGTIELSDNSVNQVTPTGNITFTLPTVTDLTVFHQILVQLNLSTVYTIDMGLGETPHYFNSTAPDLSSTGVYNLIFEYDNTNGYWVGGAIAKGVIV